MKRKPAKRASEGNFKRKVRKKRGRKRKEPETAVAVVPSETSMVLARQHSDDAQTLWEAAMAPLSPATRYAYAGEWRRFGEWWDVEPVEGESLHQTTLKRLCEDPEPFEARKLVLAYLDYLDHEKLGSKNGEPTFGVAPATRARAIRALNTMVKKLNFVGFIAWTLEVPPGKVSARRDTAGPDQKVWKKLLRHVKRTGTRQDVALLHAVRTLALRRSEAVAIKLSDLNPNRQRLSLIGKGDKFATIELHPKLWELFCLVAEEQKRDAAKRGKKAVFLFGDPVEGNSGDWLYRKVRTWGEEIGVPLWTHALRHSGITRAARLAARSNMGARELQQFSRHSKAETALRYIEAAGDAAKKIADGMLDE